MRTIAKHFINGDFVESHGTAVAEVRNPTTNELIGRVTMGDAVDAERAIAAAKAAFPGWSLTTLDERTIWLQRIADALTERLDELVALCIAVFGGLASFSRYAMSQARDFFVLAQDTLAREHFEQTVNHAQVTRVPLGVAGLLAPWNGNPARPQPATTRAQSCRISSTLGDNSGERRASTRADSSGTSPGIG